MTANNSTIRGTDQSIVRNDGDVNRVKSKGRRIAISTIVQYTSWPKCWPHVAFNTSRLPAQGLRQCKARSKQLPKAVKNVSAALVLLIFVMKENGS